MLFIINTHIMELSKSQNSNPEMNFLSLVQIKEMYKMQLSATHTIRTHLMEEFIDDLKEFGFSDDPIIDHLLIKNKYYLLNKPTIKIVGFASKDFIVPKSKAHPFFITEVYLVAYLFHFLSNAPIGCPVNFLVIIVIIFIGAFISLCHNLCPHSLFLQQHNL